ncbi:MAG: hypothetical protein JWQ78_1699, partial [Sediminibacterium sp.]|nr:hypothetical protein [Sediminibacterium sp.]
MKFETERKILSILGRPFKKKALILQVYLLIGVLF